ncbi:UNVERIFIED_ORG: hypothetical protein J2W82_005053 [Pseudomonas mohnii]|nr:hypothetical protein [Pseudomonas mohnii]
MANSYDLTQLDTHSFESMVNFLALRVLGKGIVGFAAGADGGRDGYLLGEAPYPTTKNAWSGTWYIQSKFHKPHLSADPQKWLVQQASDEIKSFLEPGSRSIPDIWILATNIEPSGKPETGAYDKIKKLVKDNLGSNVKFDIWGGRKILDFLALDPQVASHYGHFLTPGNVLTTLFNTINDEFAQVNSIIDHLIVNQFNEQNYTKLEQAGSSADTRPKIHQLFVDLPYNCDNEDRYEKILQALTSSSAHVHKISIWGTDIDRYRAFSKIPTRARVFILKGGPGQGKSTVGQFFAQIHRASLILSDDAPKVSLSTRETAEQLKKVALNKNYWTSSPRIPVLVELKDFATWYGSKSEFESKGVLSYISEKISQKTEQRVLPGTLKRAFQTRSWFFNFDGLDEVPNDVKDKVAEEIIKFTDEQLTSIDADALILCTTRPQGYSGQFDKLDATVAVLTSLPRLVALNCATAVVRFGRSESEGDEAVDTLNSAMDSAQVRELMTTPLQSHIMAVVVRDGGRPPEKRWELFDNFYKVMKKRESQKNFQDARVAKLLREGDTLLKAIHSRLGISLHALAENSKGAETKLEKEEFSELSYLTVNMLMDENVEETVSALMEATTERLVFVNTPESSTSVRFDIRQLQEFFAGEFIYSDVSPAIIRSRIEVICTDAHWREVMHFLLSALVANGRTTELVNAAEVLIAADSCEDCHKTRIFRRRMAVGALLSLRLLNEGVLEQDKRIRQHFANVLPPLFGVLEEQVLSTLANLANPNTSAWVINLMIEHLFDASEEEQIGAAIVLSRSLPDNHPQVERVRSKIMKSSATYLECVYFFLQPDRIRRQSINDSNQKVSNTWFLEATLDLLCERKPRTNFDYSLPYKLIEYNKYRTAKTPAFQKLSITETRIFFALFDVEGDLKPASTNQTNSYKGLSFVSYAHNWRSGTTPSSINFEIDNSENLGPFLNFCASAITVSNHTSAINLKRFLDLSISFKNYTDILPSYMQALIPIDPWSVNEHSTVNPLGNLSLEQLDKFIKSGKLGDRTVHPTVDGIGLRGNFSSASWKKFCRDCPTLALGLGIQEVGEISLDPEHAFYGKGIIEVAFKYPELCAPHILRWGKLFNIAGDDAPLVREHFLKNHSVQFANDNYTYDHSSDIFPFKIDLITEIIWLPMLAARLVEKLNYGGSQYRNNPFARKTIIPEALLAEFGLDYAVLRSIFNDKEQPTIIRQAAIACYFILEFPESDNQQDHFYHEKLNSTFLELLDEQSPSWLITSFFKFSEKNLSHKDVRSAYLVAHCLNLYRGNYEVRRIMQTLLSRWRERSSAPISETNSLQTWLGQQV